MHPVYDSAALQAQRRRDEIDGHLNTHYAGAYWGYGFHEDGVQSALTTTKRPARENAAARDGVHAMRRSALYDGTVMHQRTGAHASGFVRRIAMPLLDLDEVDDLTDLAPLWRAERPAPITYRRRDFMGDPDTSLRTTVLDLVERRAGFRPDGPVRLLAHHRSWGWCFNPIASTIATTPARRSRRS